MNADNIHLTMAFPYPETAFHKTAEEENLLETDDIYELMIHQRVRVGAKPSVLHNIRTDDLNPGRAALSQLSLENIAFDGLGMLERRFGLLLGVEVDAHPVVVVAKVRARSPQAHGIHGVIHIYV